MFVPEIQLSPTNVALSKRIWISSAIAKSEVDNWPSNQIWLFAELKAELKAVSSGEPQNRVSQWCNAFTDMSHSELQRCWKKQADQGAQLPMLRSAVVSKWGPTQQAPHYTVPGTTPAPTTSANKREQEIMEKQRRRESGEGGMKHMDVNASKRKENSHNVVHTTGALYYRRRNTIVIESSEWPHCHLWPFCFKKLIYL